MINFYAHTGSGNHGCEAIVRASAKILGNDITLLSIDPEQDIKYNIDEVCAVKPDYDIPCNRRSLTWLLSAIQMKLTKKIDLNIKQRRRHLLDTITSGDICLSIGGDNYCYKGTDILAALNRNIRKKRVKTVLWGCSVEPSALEQKHIAEDLASFDLITARESISYNALKKVNPNTVLVSDPAFALDKVELPLPNGWVEGNMVGVNVSPLILESSKNGELVLDAYRKLISYIINETPNSVALIPHVVWKNNDDRIPLRQLWEEFKDTGKVIMIEDHNCMELKGYISRCRFFIGARTHATIAAYSTCVPTLVLGYSVKSIGIATDLFVTADNYVLPVQTMNNSDELLDAFKWIYNKESYIRKHLERIMPEYINNAYKGKEAVESFCNGGK